MSINEEHAVKQLLCAGFYKLADTANLGTLHWCRYLNKWEVNGHLFTEVHTYDYFEPAWEKFRKITCTD